MGEAGRRGSSDSAAGGARYRRRRLRTRGDDSERSKTPNNSFPCWQSSCWRHRPSTCRHGAWSDGAFDAAAQPRSHSRARVGMNTSSTPTHVVTTPYCTQEFNLCAASCWDTEEL